MGSAQANAAPLTADEVVQSVAAQYPPMLAALIERDIAAGRLRSALGTFDFQVFAKVFGNPTGYYEQGTVDAGFEQFTGVWGSTIYGGYRLNRGDTLPDYEKNRTDKGGELRLGFRLPLLKDGRIDSKRAALEKARLDRELADPSIQRQQLDFVRAATVAYYGWLGAGQRWKLAEDVLRVAEERGRALAGQVAVGLLAPLTVTDNERLIVSRSLAAVQARRRFEAAALTLSLFLRDAESQPVVAGRERLPGRLPEPPPRTTRSASADLDAALRRRPEVRRFELALAKARVDLKLARNQMLPNLDAGAMVSDNLGGERYQDRAQTELQVGLELRMPLQRREARGRVEEFEAQVEQLTTQQRFARDRIAAEVADATSALVAAHEQTVQAARNVFLAGELQEAERERFRVGASDLLAVQIREQAAFDAQVLEVDARMDYFRAEADLAAATAASAPGAARAADAKAAERAAATTVGAPDPDAPVR